MAPKRSTSEKVKAFFTNPFRRASTTSKGRPAVFRPDPFLSQNIIHPQDVQTSQDARNRNRSANVPSTRANPSSSQDTRQPRSNLPFGERMKADFRAGVDETNAALMGPLPNPHRHRDRDPSRVPLAAPTPAHLGASRTPLNREREPSRRIPISAPVARANLGSSAPAAPNRDRSRERARERARVLEHAFQLAPPPVHTVSTHRVQLHPPGPPQSVQLYATEPIHTVPTHRIQLHPPAARESVHVQVSGGTSSSSSRETRWDDFAGPAPTAPLPPLPSAPPPAPAPARRNATSSRRAVPATQCRLCQAQAAVGGGHLCAYCRSVAFYPEDYPRASVYPVMSPAFAPPPPVAHLKDSSYIKARRSQQSQSQTQTQPHRTRSHTQPPTPRIQPRRTQSRDDHPTSHRVSPITPDEERFRRSVLSPVSPIIPDEENIHPALRRSSHRFSAAGERLHEQSAGGSSRRGAVSGTTERGERPVVPRKEGLWGGEPWFT